MREILPNIFQIGSELFTAEQHLSYFIVGKFGNVLTYPPLLSDEDINAMIQAGGLNRILLNRWDQVGTNLERLFHIFASAVVLPQPREMLDSVPFLWVDGSDFHSPHKGMQVISARVSQQYWYILEETEGRMFFPGDSLYLLNGHWRVDPLLPRDDRKQLLAILESQRFDYIMPNRARGLISFQKLEADIQAIEARVIKQLDTH